MTDTRFAELNSSGQIRRLRNLVVKLLREDGFSPHNCRFIEHQHNTSFCVASTSGELRFIRVSRSVDRSPRQIQSEIEWLIALADEGHPVICPIPWSDRTLLRDTDDPRLGPHRTVTQFAWCPGKVEPRPPAEQWHAIGAALARLHDHTRRNPHFGEGRWVVDEMVGNHDDPAAAERDVVEALGAASWDIIRTVRDQYRAVRSELGSVQLIHGDLHHWNVLTENGQITLVDFDDSGFAPLLYDLCVPISAIRNKQLPDAEQALIAGYTSVAPLPADLDRHLPILLANRKAQETAWLIGERHIPTFAPWWEKHCRKEIDRLREFISE